MEKVNIQGVPETMNPFIMRHMKEKSIEASKARFIWGLKNGRDLERMVPELTWIKDVSLVEGMKELYPVYPCTWANTACQKHLQQAGNAEKIGRRQFVYETLIQGGVSTVQELNYLKRDKKMQGQESFVTYVDFQVQDGTADMWLYDIFPGVQLMVVDFASESCFRNSERQNVIGINHCRKGRFECAFDSRNYLYLGEGDIALNSQMHPPIASSFPLKYFYGSTIILFPEIMKTVPELQAFQISAEKIAEKYSLETKSPVFRRNAEIEHVYQELYTHLGHPSLPFLRLKVQDSSRKCK